MYHITDKGEPGVCRAVRGKCPFGSEADHYTSANQARHAFEAKMAEAGLPGGLQKSTNTSVDMSYEAHDEAFNQADHSIDYTPDQVMEKFKREIEGHTYALGELNNPGEPGLILERLFGKEPDADPTADLGTVELKTLRATSLARHISLGALKIGGNARELREKYLGGNFQRTLKAGEWTHVGDNYYTLLVDRKQRKVRLIIANSKKEFVSTNDFGWDFSTIDHKVDNKLANIAVGLYDTDSDLEGHKTVTFQSLVMGGFTRESMIDKLESGEVRIDFRFADRYSRTTLVSKLQDFSELNGARGESLLARP